MRGALVKYEQTLLALRADNVVGDIALPLRRWLGLLRVEWASRLFASSCIASPGSFLLCGSPSLTPTHFPHPLAALASNHVVRTLLLPYCLALQALMVLNTQLSADRQTLRPSTRPTCASRSEHTLDLGQLSLVGCVEPQKLPSTLGRANPRRAVRCRCSIGPPSRGTSSKPQYHRSDRLEGPTTRCARPRATSCPETS